MPNKKSETAGARKKKQSVAWKSLEREASRFFGTSRAALSGSNGKLTSSDTMHDTLFIECKYRKRCSVWSLYKETAALAAKEGKIPVVVLKEAGGDGFLVVLHNSHWKTRSSQE